MIREIQGRELQPGHVIALPMGRTATVREVKVGRVFATFVTEHGKSRVGLNDPVLLEVDE
jgi:hypothetical protein